MKIQMHNEISNAIGLDRDLEFDLDMVEVDSKERNWRNDKKELKNYVFPFRMIMRKFHTIMRNGPKGICVANQREISKLILYNHAKILHSHVKCSRKAKIGVDAFFTSHNHAKLLDLVRNGHCITKLQISRWKTLRKTS